MKRMKTMAIGKGCGEESHLTTRKKLADLVSNWMKETRSKNSCDLLKIKFIISKPWECGTDLI